MERRKSEYTRLDFVISTKLIGRSILTLAYDICVEFLNLSPMQARSDT